MKMCKPALKVFWASLQSVLQQSSLETQPNTPPAIQIVHYSTQTPLCAAIQTVDALSPRAAALTHALLWCVARADALVQC